MSPKTVTMKCFVLNRIILMMMIALSIGLSNTFYAQTGHQRPHNDDCSEAIRLAIAEQSTYHEFSLEGAGRSTNLLASLCEENEVSEHDVWFAMQLPENGRLDLFLRSEKGCPALAIYYGNCSGMSYLVCDATKINDTEKFISIRETNLANQDILVRVFTTDALSNNVFEIKAETNFSNNVAIGPIQTSTTDQGIQINWTTNAETQLFYTLLQHSTDGVLYTNISSFKGRNNDAVEQYTFMHREPQVGENYYRLVLVHDNGEQTISNERAINIDRFKAQIRVFPNPASKGVTLQLPQWIPASPATLFVTSMLGQELHQINMYPEPGAILRVDFDQYHLADGIYYLRLIQDDKLVMNHQLSIQH